MAEKNPEIIYIECVLYSDDTITYAGRTIGKLYKDFHPSKLLDENGEQYRYYQSCESCEG
jgi:hypothetical protein